MIALLYFFVTLLVSPLKSKSPLDAEKAALRHQLIMLWRKRPGFDQRTTAAYGGATPGCAHSLAHQALSRRARRLLPRARAVRQGAEIQGRSRQSAREYRRLTQKGVVVDLLDEKIRHVGARDESACPAARIDQRAIGVRL